MLFSRGQEQEQDQFGVGESLHQMKFRAAEEVTPDSVLQSSYFSLSCLGDMADSGDSSGKNVVERVEEGEEQIG